MYKDIFRDYPIPRKASAFLDLLPVCIFHRNVLYSCPRVRRTHTLCPWGVDLSLGSRGLWSEWRALIFKHVLLRERGGKWFMIYTVVSQLRRSTLRKDSMIPPCLCALLSSRSYRVQLSSHIRSPRTMSFLWLFHSRLLIFPSYFFTTTLVNEGQFAGLDVYVHTLLYQGSRNISLPLIQLIVSSITHLSFHNIQNTLACPYRHLHHPNALAQEIRSLHIINTQGHCSKQVIVQCVFYQYANTETANTHAWWWLNYEGNRRI